MFDYTFEQPPLTQKEIQQEIDYLVKNDKEINHILTQTKTPILIKDFDPNIRALYHIKKKQIWVNNTGIYPGQLKEMLLHECIHCYDHLINKINIGTKEGLARSEVHAMRECECAGSWFRRWCTYYKAIQAVTLSTGNHEAARSAVDSVFSDAYYEDIFHDPYN
ncbi:hypothetical protein TVAG_138310 [Trichomonas vaginalis G3]|uniref:Mitochondrial inner membrane protease ATP23 n=1 Tax=Trichomonas vaginalis (strain ATCC PRA-98 / G3) TaxID=412133 RepID=A2ENI4_TRIV3|nr:peptidase M76 family [Trichomonas vaginalis G3]EAY05762.1 hypothetical protein TVAG_138310 [Trichomonas vaginalis G3]KAI5511421.1 peptidase M76 family [Trichomonas vaginalis G3]|eukprot:XP_001317985.1 hypothetical protein [Trichomonas vaginalis G3]